MNSLTLAKSLIRKVYQLRETEQQINVLESQINDIYEQLEKSFKGRKDAVVIPTTLGNIKLSFEEGEMPDIEILSEEAAIEREGKELIAERLKQLQIDSKLKYQKPNSNSL